MPQILPQVPPLLLPQNIRVYMGLELRIGISVVFQWTHSPTPPPPSCCCHRRQCRRRMYSNIFEYLCHRIYSYSYLVFIFQSNIFVFVFGFYFLVEYIRIRIRWSKNYSLTYVHNSWYYYLGSQHPHQQFMYLSIWIVCQIFVCMSVEGRC